MTQGISADIAKPGFGTDANFDASFAYHFGLNKPVIAAMNGPAAGVGLALACFADLRFAVPGVKFTTAHGKLNLPAEYGLSWMLPKIVGLGRANDLLLTSRVFTSDEALQLGFVNQIFAPADLVEQTLFTHISWLPAYHRIPCVRPDGRSTGTCTVTWPVPL